MLAGNCCVRRIGWRLPGGLAPKRGGQEPRMGVMHRERIGEILADALRLPMDERETFVRHACAGDPDLETEVRSLLGPAGRAGGFLAQPTTGDVAARGPTSEGPGTVIGRYRLLELIGEGGFGSVFAAEQREPVTRLVALKILKPGMDTKAVIARFEAERQALAMMDHAGIAKVLDAGATAS